MTRSAGAAARLLAFVILSAGIAGCGGAAATPSVSAAGSTLATAPGASSQPTPPPASPSGSPSGSASASGASGAPSDSPTPTEDATYHVDPALEALLPSRLMTVDLTKLSLGLDTYLHDNSGSDAKLYTEWMHQLGLSIEAGTIAIAHDFSDQKNITIIAIRPKGADPTRLTGAVKAAAEKLSWPVENVVVAQKDVLEVIDPSADPSTGRGAAAVYSKDGVTYFVVTDDAAMRLEVFIRLP